MRQILAHKRGIPIRQILSEVQFADGNDLNVTSCCHDSRQCQPGDLFAAIVGNRQDGHDFAAQAVERGAAAVLAERYLPVSVPTVLVSDTRKAFGHICHALAGNPCDKMRVLGVSGTHGKTVTSLLIAAVLDAAKQSTGIIGSLGYCDGDAIHTNGRTTPGPAELANWLGRAAGNGCSHTVVEASSNGLAEQRLAGVELDAAVLTNVRRAHLDRHGSVLAYRRIKQRLFEYLKPEGFAILNADDPASQFLLSEIEHPVLTVGMNRPAELMAEVIERHQSEQTFLMTAGDETIPVRTAMIGDHHVYNCLAATAVGLVLGIDLETAVRGLETLTSVPGRMERVECGQDFGTFVDVARNPDALAVSLKALRRVTPGKLICVYGHGVGDRGERPLLGRVVERRADVGIITSANPGDEEPLQIAHDILDGYDRPAQAHVMPDRARAIGWALHEARAGDTVLIAGRGSEKVHVVEGRRDDFDDRAVARYFLRKMDS